MKIAIRSRQVLAILGLAVLLAVPVAAQSKKGPRERFAERLNLTQEQREQLQDLRRDGRREAVLRRGEIASLRSRIQAEFLKDTVDAAAVQSLGEELGRLTGKAVEARLAQRVAFLQVLTPEQREQLQDMRGQRHRGRGHRGQRGHHGGGVPQGQWN